MLKLMKNLLTEEKGQGLAEYGLILALISLAAIATMGPLGTQIKTIFDNVRVELGGTPTPP
ncbi:MAG: Flp family type IVb pilin [Clostridia bacterium]|nr:Flp family type IVb pilin [Clostridia bacterium]